MKLFLRQYGMPAFMMAFTLVVFGFNAVSAATTYSWDADPGYPTYEDVGLGCTSNSTCTFSCNAGNVGRTCVSNACTSYNRYLCDPWWDTNNCGNSLHTEWTCTAHGICTPDSSCAASTYVGSTCYDSCGNQYAGTKPAACVANPSCAASTYVGSTCYDSCGNAYAGTVPYPGCTPDSSCAASTNVGSTCYDSCGNGYAGTKPAACVPSTSCAATTCAGSTCSDGCGGTVAGTLTTGSCAPVCSAPSVTLTANPTRVSSGSSSVLTVTGSGISASCTVTNKQTGATIRTVTASSCTANGTSISTGNLSNQTTFLVSCDAGAATAQVIVNVNPVFKPF